MTSLSKSAVRDLMKKQGGYLVEEDAVNYLAEVLAEKALDVSRKALDNAIRDSRNKVEYRDLYNVVGSEMFDYQGS